MFAQLELGVSIDPNQIAQSLRIGLQPIVGILAEMGLASKLRGSYFGGRSSTANTTPRQPPRNPGIRAERAAGDTSGIADNKRELAFAAVLALVGIAALFPALYYGVRAPVPIPTPSNNP